MTSTIPQIVFEACKMVDPSRLERFNCLEPFVFSGHVYATDARIIVRVPVDSLEDFGPGDGVYVPNAGDPRRLPELAGFFDPALRRLRSQALTIPADAKQWRPCPCTATASLRYCLDCDQGRVPDWSSVVVRRGDHRGDHPVAFASYYLGMLRELGVDHLWLLPGEGGMKSYAFFFLGDVEGILMPKTFS